MPTYNEVKKSTPVHPSKVSTYTVNPPKEEEVKLKEGVREKRDPQLKARRHKFDVDFKKWISYLGNFETMAGKLKAMESLDGMDRLKRKLIQHFKMEDYVLAKSGINLEAEIILLEKQKVQYESDKNISTEDSKKLKDIILQIEQLKRAIKINKDETDKRTRESKRIEELTKPEEKTKLSKSEEDNLRDKERTRKLEEKTNSVAEQDKLNEKERARKEEEKRRIIRGPGTDR